MGTHDTQPLLPSATSDQQIVGEKAKRGVRKVMQESVNDSTIWMAPGAPVKEMGNVLLRLLRFMQEVPPEEHIQFSKINLADGYWRMIVEEKSCWNFAYVFPGPPDTPIKLVIPSALQMGWNESPAYFCAATETTQDVAQSWIDTDKRLLQHDMEPLTTPTTHPRGQMSTGDKYQMSAVYVDDFILAAVQNREGTLLTKAIRATLHAIHNVFPAPTAEDLEGAKECRFFAALFLMQTNLSPGFHHSHSRMPILIFPAYVPGLFLNRRQPLN
jgi:hypothetical protein